MDEIWKRDEVNSPCVKICVIHPDAEICVGCFRTLEEIADWSILSNADRSEILGQLDVRGKALAKRRGGRAGRTPPSLI